MKARPDPDRLTPVQLEILNLVWDRGECTITFLWEQLKQRRPVARNTVLTLVNRLEERGWLRRRGRARSFTYSARITREKTRSHRLREMVDQLFDGSAEDLVRSLLGSELVERDEIARLKKLLAEAESGSVPEAKS